MRTWKLERESWNKGPTEGVRLKIPGWSLNYRPRPCWKSCSGVTEKQQYWVRDVFAVLWQHICPNTCAPQVARVKPCGFKTAENRDWAGRAACHLERKTDHQGNSKEGEPHHLSKNTGQIFKWRLKQKYKPLYATVYLAEHFLLAFSSTHRKRNLFLKHWYNYFTRFVTRSASSLWTATYWS